MSSTTYEDPSSSLLAGQVGLVTGAGSGYGIGRSLVKKLAEAGAAVIYASDLNTANIPSLQQQIKRIRPGCIVECLAFDVASEEETHAALTTILQKHGRFDFFFANAGFTKMRTINQLESSHFELAHKVMAMSVFHAIKLGARAMVVTSREKPVGGGRIVVTASTAGSHPSYGDIAYSTAKSAAIGLVRSGAVHLAGSNVRVNGVAPGVTQTAISANSDQSENKVVFHEKADESEAKDSYKQFLATKGLDADAIPEYSHLRTIQPDEIAQVGVFLASELSSAINGQVVTADNGRSAAFAAPYHIGPLPAIKPLL